MPKNHIEVSAGAVASALGEAMTSRFIPADGIVDSSLGYLFTTMMDLYQKDASPAADIVDALVLERTNAGTLSLSHDSNGVDDSYTAEYTWSVDDGTQRVATSHSKANALVTLVNNVSWSSLVSLDGAQSDAYGFDDPILVHPLRQQLLPGVVQRQRASAGQPQRGDRSCRHGLGLVAHP